MRGIIVKPSLCCGSTRSLGLIVNIEGQKLNGTSTCERCGTVVQEKHLNHYLITDMQGRPLTCEKSRIQILPDDVDNSEVVVEEKELENV